VLHPSVKANSVAELIALARREPGKLTYASIGVGSIQHLAGERFKQLAGIDLLHVPYKGSGPALTDLLAGQVSLPGSRRASAISSATLLAFTDGCSTR